MKLTAKILWLVVVPLLCSATAIGALFVVETKRLEHLQSEVADEALMAARKDEVRNYITLALTSIDHLYGSGRDDAVAKEEAKAILNSMNYGDDGYFFVYGTDGMSIVHPRQPDLPGTNQWNKRDADGVYVIRELLARAKEGGGFQHYLWPKPSNGKVTRKLSYAVLLPRWGWMLGTGIYLDEVDAAVARMRSNLLSSVQDMLLGMAAVGLVATLAIFAGGLALNVSDKRLADRKLKTLAHRVVTSQEEERARVSRELHDHICQLLVSIKYQFELVGHRLANPQPEPIRSIDREIAALSTAISEVRRISHDLRPAVLDDLGLATALEHIGNELAQRSSMAVRVQARVCERHLSELQAANLFRVAQEALRNAERHSHASHVDIRLHEQDDRVVLHVSDDGDGFDVRTVEQSKDRGIGLTNMRERVERNGGRFDLVSQPGWTLLTASFPVQEVA